MKVVANIISYVFHPLWMPLLAMAFYLKFMFFLQVNPAFYRYVMLVMAVCTLLFPLISIYMLKSSKAITSVHMPTKEERRWPLLLGTFFFFLAYMLIKLVSPVDTLTYITIAGIATMMVTTLINLLYKLSIHMAAIGGLTGMLLAYAHYSQIEMFYVILPLIVVAGLVGFARLQLNAHSGGQVILGYFTGFFTQFILLRFLTVI